MSAAPAPGPAPSLSVVVPVYNEAGNAGPLCEEICAVMTAIGRPFEIIFVNDGSRDTTLDELLQQATCAPRLRILDLDGNFGEAAALCAGFRAARGDLVITLDGDGQNDPRDIPRLLAPLERTGCQVVSGWRQQRQERLWRRVLPSRLANQLIATVTRIPVHDNGCGLKAYRRSVVQQAALPRGMNRFMPAILGVTAAEVAEVPVNDRRRQYGRSHYGFSRILVVVRDVLAVRFIIARRRWSAAVAAAVAAGGALGCVRGLWYGQPWGALVAACVAGAAATIWWGVRRFARAQRDGVFRVRREYSAAADGLVQSA
jgi:glycosyltransferase involved in cell wall biosynthesis